LGNTQSQSCLRNLKEKDIISVSKIRVAFQQISTWNSEAIEILMFSLEKKMLLLSDEIPIEALLCADGVDLRMIF
jgi:hypothetical protein